MDFTRYLKEYPDQEGKFGKYGGSYLPEQLIPAMEDIHQAYQTICHSSQFVNELRRIRKEFQGRPTPVYHCERLSRMIGNCQIYLKREDLNHTGAHKLNHCMGEGLLAKFMGKPAHRGDRRRAAWRGARDSGGVLRLGMHDLYGRGGYRETGAECGAHESAGRECGLCDAGAEDLEGGRRRSI